jgi:alpha/beta superfamily hydrolase
MAEPEFFIPGPLGVLEAIATVGDEKNNTTAIICHPHPLQSGTMHNKVVTTLMRTFRELGCHTIRFNYRGVGQSAGSYGEGIGETDDLFAVMDWVKQTTPQHDVILAGFSFGGCVAMRAAALRSVKKLITIAPPVMRCQLSGLPAITCPWIMVQGELDDVVPPQEVYQWLETVDPKPELIRFPTAGHFFHGQLIELREGLIKVLR